MDILTRIDQLRALAEGQQKGDAAAHHGLLKELRQLQIAIESPIETASRVKFQVLLILAQTPAYALTSPPDTAESVSTYCH